MREMNSRQTVLVADSDADVLRTVSENISGLGVRVVTARSTSEALEAVRQFQPALMIVELLMPETPGPDLLRKLKSDPETAKCLIIILSQSNQEVDRIVSFELGADDYVTKPFSMRELTLRTKALLTRRSSAPAARYVEVGAIALDREGHEVSVSGKRVPMTAREYMLLQALFTHPGKVFSRDELLNMAWGHESTIDSRTVDTHFRRLRVRLGNAARQIQTVRGFGYRLDAK